MDFIKAFINNRYDMKHLPLNERITHILGGCFLLFLSSWLQYFMLKSMIDSLPKANSPIITVILHFVIILSLFGLILWSSITLYEGIKGEGLVLNKQALLAKDNIAKKARHIYEHWAIRYFIASIIAGFTYYLHINTGINWIGISILMLIACWYAIEMTMYTLGLILICGALYCIYLLVVALPVSLAIILGALIIAAAIKKRCG
jgi:hypothetical protein